MSLSDRCVTGGDRVLTLEDREEMPYLEAVFLETQRIGSVLPISPPRLATKDITVQGYT